MTVKVLILDNGVLEFEMNGLLTDKITGLLAGVRPSKGWLQLCGIGGGGIRQPGLGSPRLCGDRGKLISLGCLAISLRTLGKAGCDTSKKLSHLNHKPGEHQYPILL